ncbi:hypothetical protein KVC36_04945 [Helicobacter pylori]|uniref:hypothetical protein n=1 Tax=Helicobacter pylori TaxID=210 RepID=UPI00165B8807|nr:hypothetical protein [Helicobacter pylori]WQS42504.1 hypothetical protein KVC36_04945 [Helicobacter pylori]WQY00651.1 hypothetical protein KVK82_04935 [Helicobacter pylori]
MTQLEDLKAHEKYNLLLCMVSGAYKGTIPGNEDFKEWCDECTLTGFRPRMDKVAEYKDFEKVRQADYAVAIVYEKSAIKGVKIQRSVFALKIDHDTIGTDEEGALVEGVCAQKGSQEYEELVNKNTWHFTHSTRLGKPKLIKRKS